MKVRRFMITLALLNSLGSVHMILIYSRINRINSKQNQKIIRKTSLWTILTLLFTLSPLTISITLTLIWVIARYTLHKKDKDLKKILNLGNDFVQGSLIFKLKLKITHNAFNDPTKIDDKTPKILNPDVLSDLEDRDDAFFDKTNTLATNEYEVKSIESTTRLYASDDGNFNPRHKIEDLSEVMDEGDQDN